MIKDVFVLKRDSWHMHMMTYIWNLRSRDFSHMCPYFWLSVFNLFIIIPIWIFKSIGKWLSSFVYTLHDARKRQKYIKKENKFEAEQFRSKNYSKFLENNPAHIEKLLDLCEDKFRDKVDKVWQHNYTLYSEIIRQRRDYQDIMREREQKKKAELEERVKANKAKINRMLKVIEPFFKGLVYLLIAIVAVFLLKLLYLTILWMGTWTLPNVEINWTYVKEAVIVVGGIILFICVFVFVWVKTTPFFKWLHSVLPCTISRKYTSWIQPTLHYISLPFIWIGAGISTIASIIYQMYKNNCPPIDWE